MSSPRTLAGTGNCHGSAVAMLLRTLHAVVVPPLVRLEDDGVATLGSHLSEDRPLTVLQAHRAEKHGADPALNGAVHDCPDEAARRLEGKVEHTLDDAASGDVQPRSSGLRNQQRLLGPVGLRVTGILTRPQLQKSREPVGCDVDRRVGPPLLCGRPFAGRTGGRLRSLEDLLGFSSHLVSKLWLESHDTNNDNLPL
jgi:hypothetical protein